MGFDAVIGLDGALLQHGYEHAGEHEQGPLQVLIRTLQTAGRSLRGSLRGSLRSRVVEVGQGDGVGHVGQLRQVLTRLVAVEEVDEPAELPGSDGVKVHHEDHGQRIRLHVQRVENFAQLQRRPVAATLADAHQMLEDRQKQSSTIQNQSKSVNSRTRLDYKQL